LESIQLADWNLLVQLPPARSTIDIQRTFYPDASAGMPVDSSSSRRPRFLPKLDAAAYHRMYETILQSTYLRFPDIQKILRVGRVQGKTVSSLMNHVVQWLNPMPSSSDRLQLWQTLLPESPEDNDREARALQSEIFNLVRDRTNELTSALLTQLPHDAKDCYQERFQLPIWRDILTATRKAVGPRFQGVLSPFNTQDPAGLPLQQEPTLTLAFCDAVSRIPHVARNPALHSSKALEALTAQICPAIATWAVQQCDEALQEQDSCRTWPLSVRELVTRQRGELDRIAPASSRVELPTHTPPPAAPGSGPESPQSERFDVENATENLVEDVTGGMLMRGASHRRSGKPEEAASQMSIEEDPWTELSFVDALPDLAEMKKQHRQLHSARSANKKAHQPPKDVYMVPQEELRREPPLSASPATPAQSRVLAPKKKLASAPWMKSPAAQASSKR